MPAKIKQILIWGLFLFLVYAIITSPNQAADIFRTAWDITWNGVQNIGRFFSSLMG